MDIRVPEREPCSQRLANVDHENQNRSTVADEPKHDSAIDYCLQFLSLEHVKQETGEERTGTEGNDGQIEVDPQTEGKTVVHIRLIQTLGEAKVGTIKTPCE